MLFARVSALCVLVALASSCVENNAQVSSQAVTYNGDSRQDVYEVSDPLFRNIAESSVAILLNRRDVDVLGDGTYELESESFGESQRLCEGERFFEQPSTNGCSGTLVARDLVLTAGHCAPAFPCSSANWVFGYYYEAPGELHTITADDVYGCSEIVTVDEGSLDYALYRLDRPVQNRTPARWVPAAMTTGESVTLIGFPSGLPMKVDQGAVTRTTSIRLTAAIDAFGGNSGSGVFAPDGTLVGVLSAGNRDFVRRGSCRVVNNIECGEDCNDGESVIRADSVQASVCETDDTLPWCANALEPVATNSATPAPTTPPNGGCNVSVATTHPIWALLGIALLLVYQRMRSLTGHATH